MWIKFNKKKRKNVSQMTKKTVEAEKSEKLSVFSCCGSISKQLDKDIAQMGISEDFIKRAYVLPMIYGYDAVNKEYFAEEPRERSNGYVKLFSSHDAEEFRWYLLKLIAEKWGQNYELTNRKKLESKWERVEDRVVDGKWIYRTNPRAKYKAVYDSRKEWWEVAIQSLAKVYDIRGEQMQKYIESCLDFLKLRGSDWSEIHWRFDEKKMKFIGIPYQDEEDFAQNLVPLFEVTVDDTPYGIIQKICIHKHSGIPYSVLSIFHAGSVMHLEEEKYASIGYSAVQKLAVKEGIEQSLKYKNINANNWKKLCLYDQDEE